MACDQSCGAMFPPGGMGGCGGGMMGCGGGMAGPQGMGAMDCGMGGGMGFPQGPAPMGYQGAMDCGAGYGMGGGMGYPLGAAPMGCQPGPFAPGSGCGGLNAACGPQGADIPPQARPRKPRPPSSDLPKRKVGSSYTTLVTPLAGAKELTEEEKKDIPADHERFDTLTLAFGTKPGTDKPPKILLTLKSPKVIDAKMSTSTAATQVHYRDLGLPDPNSKVADDAKSRTSTRSRKSKRSTKTGKSKGSKKASKAKKGKK